MNFDQQLFFYLNNLSSHSWFLQEIVIFFGEYSQYILGLYLAVLLFFPKEKKQQNRIMVFISLCAACIARWGVKTAILLFYHRPRPFVILSGVHKLIATYPYENYQSFPSGHAIFFFALATCLFLFDRKLGSWYILAAFVMGIARVMAGVHWPSDILGGAILGIFVGWLTYKFYSMSRYAKIM
jgi:undecaprenyl-diphosphatase